MTRVSVRQHWFSLLHPVTFIMVLITLVLGWMAVSPRQVVSYTHLTRESPEFGLLHLFYDKPIVFISMPLIVLAITLLCSWSWWSISYIVIDEYALRYKLGPFREKSIPLRAIQSTNKVRGIFGVIFGYGTITVDAGITIETLTFVPQIEDFQLALQPDSGPFR